MFFLKNLHFQRNIYPTFHHNLDLANKNESAIVFMDVSARLLTIMVIINFNLVLFKKRADSPLIIEHFHFLPELKNPTNEIYSLIKKTKHNASTVKNHHFVENFGELLNKIKMMFKINLEQQHNIWDEVLNLDNNFFLTSNTLVLPEGTNNKWVD